MFAKRPTSEHRPVTTVRLVLENENRPPHLFFTRRQGAMVSEVLTTVQGSRRSGTASSTGQASHARLKKKKEYYFNSRVSMPVSLPSNTSVVRNSDVGSITLSYCPAESAAQTLPRPRGVAASFPGIEYMDAHASVSRKAAHIVIEQLVVRACGF
jgi:hypothetical protein